MKYLLFILVIFSFSINAKTLLFLSDLEGNGEKWNTFIKSSGCFSGSSPSINKQMNGYQNVQKLKQIRALSLKTSCIFFFLGDAVDKGNDTIRILRDLVYLKEVFPRNVRLVPGNREINKLRWLQEISKDGKIIPENFYKFTMSKFPPSKANSYIKNKSYNKIFGGYFGGTFGAPKAMDFRSEELGLNDLKNNNFHDWIKKILISLREDVGTYKNRKSGSEKGGPSRGLLRRYLELSEVVIRHKDILLSHGYIGPDSLGEVPGSRRMQTSSLGSIDQWIKSLNKFKDKNLKIIIEKGQYNQEQKNAKSFSHGKFAGNELILYQEPLLDGKNSFNQKSVVLGRNSNGADFGNVFDISLDNHGKTTRKLSMAGINVRISGHTPAGQSSLIQKASIKGRPVSWNINVDNSAEHSRMNGITNIFKLVDNSDFYSTSMVKIGNNQKYIKAIFKKDGRDNSQIGERYKCKNLNFTAVGMIKGTKNHLLYRAEAKFQTNNLESNLKNCHKITGTQLK